MSIEQSGPRGVPEVYGEEVPHPGINVTTFARGGDGSPKHVIAVDAAGMSWFAIVADRDAWRTHWSFARVIRSALDPVPGVPS